MKKFFFIIALLALQIEGYAVTVETITNIRRVGPDKGGYWEITSNEK